MDYVDYENISLLLMLLKQYMQGIKAVDDKDIAKMMALCQYYIEQITKERYRNT